MNRTYIIISGTKYWTTWDFSTRTLSDLLGPFVLKENIISYFTEIKTYTDSLKLVYNQRKSLYQSTGSSYFL